MTYLLSRKHYVEMVVTALIAAIIAHFNLLSGVILFVAYTLYRFRHIQKNEETKRKEDSLYPKETL